MSDLAQAAQTVRQAVDGNDSELIHVNPQERRMLRRIFGERINPRTGLPQYGWLQDLSSEFSIRRIPQLFHDPHGFFEHYATKGLQRTVGPIALEFLGPWGKIASIAARAWLAHESTKPGSSNYRAPDSTPAAQAVQGVATTGASSAIPSTRAAPAASQEAADASARLAEAQQLKDWLIQQYQSEGRADDPQLQADIAEIDRMYNVAGGGK